MIASYMEGIATEWLFASVMLDNLKLTASIKIRVCFASIRFQLFSWLLHNYILCNLGLIAIAVANYIYREIKGYGGDKDE